MTPGTDPILPFLQRLRLFSDLSEREKTILASVFTLRRLNEGDVVCREGERGRSFYITAAGSILVQKELAGGGTELLSTVGPDNVLGQVSLIDRQPRSATLVAAGPAVVLECSAGDFDRLFWAGTPFAYKLLDMMAVELSRRLREADRALYDLYSNPGETLLRLHEAAVDVRRKLDDQDRT